MSQIDAIPCPSCREKGRDRSGDNLKVFQQENDSVDGFCFVCKTVYKDPYQGEKFEGSKQEVKDSIVSHMMDVVPTLPYRDIPSRGLTKETCEYFDVRAELSEEDGSTVVAHYYPDTKKGHITGYEARKEPKGLYGIGDRKGALELWGTKQAKRSGSKKLIITEGRCDTMAVYQSIREHTPEKWKHLHPSVVSLTRGAGGACKDIISNREFVESYEEVILCFDNDEPGEEAVREVLKVFPRFLVAKLPLKDANDMLLEGRTKELRDKVIFKAAAVRQGEVVDVVDFIEEAMKKPTMGISLPWPSATRACFGIRPHTIHIIGAAPKIGKTDHEHQLIEHLVFVEGEKVGVFDLENVPKQTAKKIASKYHKLDYTRPDVDYDDATLREGLMAQQGMVRFYDRGASRDWEDIRIAMEELYLLDGICYFILDPLTALISRYSASEANDRLNEICTDMADLVMKYPITIFCYSHVNPKPKGAAPHEKGAPVLTSEFTGSRAMEKWFHYAWGIRRDRSPDCPEDRKNVSRFDLLFDREFGQSASFDVVFDPATVSYLEPKKLGSR